MQKEHLLYSSLSINNNNSEIPFNERDRGVCSTDYSLFCKIAWHMRDVFSANAR